MIGQVGDPRRGDRIHARVVGEDGVNPGAPPTRTQVPGIESAPGADIGLITGV